MKTFGTIKTNVGNNVMDTSTAFAAILGNYVHNRYFDVLRRTNWHAIDEDYSFSLSAAATMVTLPSDFGKEVAVYDTTNKIELNYISLNDLYSTFPDEIDKSGDVSHYSIVETVNSSNQRYKYFKPYKIPTDALTVKMPYSILPTTLASDGALMVIPCEDIVEIGTTADAWRYKRQFAKAAELEGLYERGIMALIWDQTNQPNQVKTFTPSPYSRETV
jgi:hypothetical protein